MPSDQPPASTVDADADAAPAPLPSSPRWKKPSPGPHPRTGDCNRGPNPSPLAPPSRRSELKRRLRESAEAAELALAAAAAARGPEASVAVDGAHQRLELAVAGGTVDVGHGAIRSLWNDADDVALLSAAAAFRERHGRAPRRSDAAALFGSVRDSVSPHIDGVEAFDELSRLESKFLHGGALGSSAGTHDRRVHDLSAQVWGLADAVSPPDGQDAEESCSAERRLITTERAPEPAAPAPRVDEPTPSDAPAPMDLDAAPAPAPPSPSPPSSKKRSTSPQSGMGDGHQDPNSSSRASPSRRSDPNRRLRGGGPAGVADQRLEPADDRRHGAAPNYHRTWSDADEVTLLEAAAAFRERTGQIPRNRDAGVLLRSIRGSISPHIDESKEYQKLRRFKSKFWHEAPGKSATAHDRLVHDLSAKVWDFGNTVARHVPAVMPVVTEVIEEYWKMNERALAGFPLEKGLSLLSRKEGTMIETRWRNQLDEEIQTQLRRHDLAKEICVLLNDTVKGLRA